MFKFIHAADLHLDSPLKGLERNEGAPADRIRRATRDAFENLIQFAIDEKVNFLLIAGDWYDGDWSDWNTGLYIIKQLAKLREAGICVYGIQGNHDAANRMTKSLRLPDNVTMFPTNKPDRKLLEEIGVVIHGQGFATRDVTDDLSLRYPQSESGLFNIGLLHTCATGRDGHDAYAPCSLDGLRSKNYDYWALGHIHQREILCAEHSIVFSGNLQGRHIRETGAKGAYLVSVEDGKQPELKFQPLDVLRWERCFIDASFCATPEEVVETTTEGLRELRQTGDLDQFLAVRIVVRGATKANDALRAMTRQWNSEIRSQAIGFGNDNLWIERIIFDTTPPGIAASIPDAPIEELLACLADYRRDDTLLQEVMVKLELLREKLPDELQQGVEAIAVADLAWLRGLLDDVQPLLLHRLHGSEAAQ